MTWPTLPAVKAHGSATITPTMTSGQVSMVKLTTQTSTRTIHHNTLAIPAG
jgi:hypothetical protein